MGDVRSADCLHHHRMLKTCHSTWPRAKSTGYANNLGHKQRADNELLQWWKGVDKNMMSNIPLQHRGLDEALHHWEQNCQDAVTASLNHRRSIDENLPPLSEMNALAAAFMSNSKHCTLVSGLQRWSTVQLEKGAEHVQQSRAGSTQTWEYSLAKEANDMTSKNKSKDNKMNEWQDWNSNEEGNYSPCQDRSLEQIMEIDDPKPDDSAESISFEASVKTLPLWTSPDCQRGKASTVLHKRTGDESQQWNKAETTTKSPYQLLGDTMQQWQKSETAVHPGPLMSMLSRFAGIAWFYTSLYAGTVIARRDDTDTYIHILDLQSSLPHLRLVYYSANVSSSIQ